MAAAPFPKNWGYEVLTGPKNDIINASLQAWSKAGETGMDAPIVSTIMIGLIPLLVGFIVYARYQKVSPSLIAILLMMLAITAVEQFYGVVLMAPIISKISYIITGFALAISFFAAFWNKN